MNEEYRKLLSLVKHSNNIVFFGGAGVSTASGIPDFRGNGGLYRIGNEICVPPETLLSYGYFRSYPDRFYKYYRANMLYPDAKPNAAHYALARLEEMGKLKAVITQNIDGLHQAAGSKTVYELHGSVTKNYCMKCGKHHSLRYITEADGVPLCLNCGGVVRPDVVLYGESLNASVWLDAEESIMNADLFIVAGSSLTVTPAADLVPLYSGNSLVIINYSETRYDGIADLIIRDSVADVLDSIINKLPES